MKHISLKRALLAVAALGILGGGIAAATAPKVDVAAGQHMSLSATSRHSWGGHH